jgi:hypothetical protein
MKNLWALRYVLGTIATFGLVVALFVWAMKVILMSYDEPAKEQPSKP